MDTLSVTRDNGQQPARAHLAEGLARGLDAASFAPAWPRPRDHLNHCVFPEARYLSGRRKRRPEATLKTVDNAPSSVFRRAHYRASSEGVDYLFFSQLFRG